MKDITFVDLEVTLNTCRVVDIGAVRSDRTPFHENSFDNLLLFLHQVPYIGGHNILKHDLSYLKPQFEKAGCRQPKIIDTLYLSSLLFPEKLHHQLSESARDLLRRLRSDHVPHGTDDERRAQADRTRARRHERGKPQARSELPELE